MAKLTKDQRRALAALVVAASGWYFIQSRRKRAALCEPGVLAGLGYAERLTKGADASQALPLVVFLHSRGADPEGFTSFANRVKVPARVLFPGGPHIKNGRHSWMTLGSITSNQAEFERQMAESGAQLADFLAEAQACFPTVGAPVVTGTSQGGHMAYYMASAYPELVRGSVAIAGWLPPTFWNPGMAQTYGGHGLLDTTVPYARTQAFWAAMQDAGADLETETFNVGHTTSGMGSWWGARVNALLGANA